MLGQKDIEQAKKLFKEWDLNQVWQSPTSEFIEHSKKKAVEQLRYLKQKKALPKQQNSGS